MKYYKCIGCGLNLQSSDKDDLGYVPDATMKKAETESILCKRCFRLKNYGEFNDVPIHDDEFKAILKSIRKEKALVVYVIDCFDINGSFVDNLNGMIGNNPVIIVANKFDVLPKSLKENKIVNRIKKYAKDNGIINVIDVVLTSGIKGYNVDVLLNAIEGEGYKNTYIVGATNVGKSTIVNAIIKKYSEEHKDIITTSKFPGTTLGKIEIEYGDGKYLIDTPGIINEHQIAHVVGEKELSKILPKKEIRQKVYQLNSGQTLFIEKLAVISFIHGPRTSFNCYFSKELNIHRTKLENKEKVWVNDSVMDYKTNAEFKKVHLKIDNKNEDIIISGLGWIRVKGPIEVQIEVPKNVKVIRRESLI